MPQTSRTRDFHLDIPDDWTDRTMISWSAPPSPGRTVTPNVVIAYDTPGDKEDLSSYVNRQLQELMSKADKFHLDLRRDMVFSGRPAIEVIFRWESGSGTLKQRQIYTLLPDRRAMVFVNTAQASDYETMEPLFLGIIQSFGWNQQG